VVSDLVVDQVLFATTEITLVSHVRNRQSRS
jgi:hypothetical protein